MIHEAYCSYEISKLLKEKGFDELCFRLIREDGEYIERPSKAWNGMTKKQRAEWYIQPTLQMACAWLREVHNKHCDIGYDIDLKWFFQIIDLKETVEYDYSETKYYHIENETGFNSYEEATEAALKYTLENLI